MRGRLSTVRLFFFCLLVVTFGYKLGVVYEVLALKYFYYFANGSLATYFIVKYVKPALRSFQKKYLLILSPMLLWVLVSSTLNSRLSLILGVSSVLNILLWGIVLPYLLTRKDILVDDLRIVLKAILYACFVFLIAFPEYSFSFGRFTGVFVAVAPSTNFLLIALIFINPIQVKLQIAGRYALVALMQFLTFTRSSIIVSSLSIVLILYVHVVRKNIGWNYLLIGALLMLSLVSINTLYSESNVFESVAEVRQGKSVEMNRTMTVIKSALPGFLGDALDDRIWHWNRGLDRAYEQPWTGQGLGSMFESKVGNAITGYHHSLQAHNLFIEAAVNFGFPMLLFVGALYLFVANRVIQIFRSIRITSELEISSAIFALACLVMAVVGIEWFAPSHFLNKFWWLSIGIVLQKRSLIQPQMNKTAISY